MLNLAAGFSQSEYTMTRSLRFRASASAYLNRTPAAGSGRTTWTWSGWVKRGAMTGTNYTLLRTNNVSSAELYFRFNTTTDKLAFATYEAGGASNNFGIVTTQVFRDPSAWYHIVLVWDTTNVTASNRIRLYINGVQVTAFDSATYPTLNYAGLWNNSSFINYQGFDPSGWYFDGYMAEINHIDGQALTPASFGETNALTGVWQPKPYVGTYGTNGFYLDFETTTSVSALGNDKSGNGNTWTVNNISLTAGVTYDSMTDVPTLTSATAANYCVVNPIFAGANSISNANLTVTYAAASIAYRQLCTFSVGSGKYYYEANLSSFAVGDVGNNVMVIGFCSNTLNTTRIEYGWRTDGSIMRHSLRYLVAGVAVTTVNINTTAFISTDILALAFDIDAGTITAYKNNVQVAQITSITNTGDWTPMVQRDGSSNAATWNFNFGQRPFAYTPPTGFVALNTFNLPTATILKGNTVMDATTYTGTLVSNAITNAAGFQPDLVWIKSRSAATDHELTDSVRGVTLSLTSNSTAAEATDVQGLTAFNANGFTIGTNTTYNNLAATYVGWQWQAGQGTTSSNTNGSITSTVSVNPTAGFSVVTYTGTGSAATVGHGLGVAPKMIIVKSRSASGQDWRVYTATVGNTGALNLNNTDPAITGQSGFWNNTSPTSSVFSLGGSASTNGNGTTYVAYCWAEIDGFSKFGSYTGNGSADGPFVYLGFRPKFVMAKRTNSTSNWNILDSGRDLFNATGKYIYANASDAEGANASTLDLTSNGFKIRQTYTDWNASGSTYIYMAFAENPTKYSLAR